MESTGSLHPCLGDSSMGKNRGEFLGMLDMSNQPRYRLRQVSNLTARPPASSASSRTAPARQAELRQRPRWPLPPASCLPHTLPTHSPCPGERPGERPCEGQLQEMNAHIIHPHGPSAAAGPGQRPVGAPGSPCKQPAGLSGGLFSWPHPRKVTRTGTPLLPQG